MKWSFWPLSCVFGGRHPAFGSCAAQLCRAEPNPGEVTGAVLFPWSVDQNELSLRNNCWGLQLFGGGGELPLIHHSNVEFVCSWMCHCTGRREAKTSHAGFCCKTVAKCFCVGKHPLIALGFFLNFKTVAKSFCVGKHPLTSGEGLRLLLRPHHPKADPSQALLEQPVSCSRWAEPGWRSCSP